jgi:hypothetical protein
MSDAARLTRLDLLLQEAFREGEWSIRIIGRDGVTQTFLACDYTGLGGDGHAQHLTFRRTPPTRKKKR